VGLLDEAEAQLASTPYLAGQAYSVADVIFTPLLFRLGMAGKTGEYLKPRPHVSGYYDRCGDGHMMCVRGCGSRQVWGLCLPQGLGQGLHAWAAIGDKSLSQGQYPVEALAALSAEDTECLTWFLCTMSHTHV
jgi:hypothetical protein